MWESWCEKLQISGKQQLIKHSLQRLAWFTASAAHSIYSMLDEGQVGSENLYMLFVVVFKAWSQGVEELPSKAV